MAGQRIKLNSGTWEGAVREISNFTDKVNVGNINRDTNEADNFASNVGILTAWNQHLRNAGYDPEDKGTVTEPTPEVPEPPISGTPLDIDIWHEANNNIRREDKDAYNVRVNAEYDSLGGTREP